MTFSANSVMFALARSCGMPAMEKMPVNLSEPIRSPIAVIFCDALRRRSVDL